MSRVLLMSAVWTLTAVGGAAQQQARPPEPPAPASAASAADEQVKLQVRNFEAILRSAVESGGRRLQKRADEMLPIAPTLAMDGVPVVLGAPHPDGGFVFTVQVPDILPSGVQLTMMQMQRNSAARPVATAPPDKVAAAGVVPDDPVRPVRPPFNPDREYSDFVREALIEAMIENSQALGVGSTGDLVVIASVPDAVRRNPLDTSRLLILSVKGEHIQAYRQGRINKEEMKLRVGDRRF